MRSIRTQWAMLSVSKPVTILTALGRSTWGPRRFSTRLRSQTRGETGGGEKGDDVAMGVVVVVDDGRGRSGKE